MKETENTISTENKYKGIRGWLILLMISLIISPIKQAFSLNNLLLYYHPGAWEAISTYGNPTYHPIFRSVVIFETCFTLFLIVAPVILLVFMIKKDSRFPKYMIIYIAIMLGFIIIDSYLSLKIYSTTPLYQPYAHEINAKIVLGLIQTTGYASIWIPYLIVSKRVKATFVNKNTSYKVSEVTEEVL
jgi:hypothetical protein